MQDQKVLEVDEVTGRLKIDRVREFAENKCLLRSPVATATTKCDEGFHETFLLCKMYIVQFTVQSGVVY